jgi:hypothetical protein
VVDNTFRLPDLHIHNWQGVHVLLLQEPVELPEDVVGFHGASSSPHNVQHQKSVASDKSKVAANWRMEPVVRSLLNEDVVGYLALRQKMSQGVGLHFLRLKLVEDTCQRIAARVASSCNGPRLAERADGYIERIVGADLANLRDCCTRSNVEGRTRTSHLSS